MCSFQPIKFQMIGFNGLMDVHPVHQTRENEDNDMNRQLSNDELALLQSFDPVLAPDMTRREKLLHFAHVVRYSRRDDNYAGRFFLFNNIEYMDDSVLARCSHPYSPFAVAAADPVLKDAGLTGGDGLSIKRFFELTTEQLHEFSCDCGGMIDNEEMARRIERLAD